MSERRWVEPKSQKPKTLLDEPNFMDNTVGLLVGNAEVLQKLAPLLSADDFRPLKGIEWAMERWVVADLALQHYEKYAEPLGELLRGVVLDYAQGLQLAE